MASDKHKEFARKIKERTFIPDGTLLDACPEVSKERRRAVWQNHIIDKIVESAYEINTETPTASQPVVINQTIVNNAPPPKAEPIRVGITELARLLNMPERTIRRRVALRQIPFENSGKEVAVKKGQRAGMKVKVGGKLSFDPVAVRKALDRQQIKAVGD